MAWDDFLAALDWQQGEHVSLIGPTGQGKTTLALKLLPKREYVAAFGTKPEDDVLDELVRSRQWRKIEKWNPRPGERRVVLWPPFKRADDQRKQRDVFRDAFRSIFTECGWTVYVDEARYVHETLKLTPYLKLLWQQGRSLGISLITTTQRPAYMPLEMYDQATHLFLWRDTDGVNLRRLASIAGDVDRDRIRAEVSTLPRHDFLYANTRTGEVLRSRVELPHPPN